jgi:hypothetical protein
MVVCCRLCDPYVTWQLIQEESGDLAAEVASKYFEENTAARRYVFRAPYSRFHIWLPQGVWSFGICSARQLHRAMH